MIITDLTNVRILDVVDIQCDLCDNRFHRQLKHHNQACKRYEGKDVCVTCAKKIGASKRPQNSPEFLAVVRGSAAFMIGNKNRPSMAGKNNPNWGKKASLETRQKMSHSRIGKVGKHATAWKGGRLSFTMRIKSALQRRYKWFHRVINRDNKICTGCGATNNLDAHHIIPIKTLITQVLSEQSVETTDEIKYNIVITDPRIVDSALDNGITLCRPCHKLVHLNWGSHEPKLQK